MRCCFKSLVARFLACMSFLLRRPSDYAVSYVERIDFKGHPDQAFSHLTYSQYGEDLIVANAFKILGIDTPTYLDIGAHHPINISNTALIHYQFGSSGVNIEANPNLIRSFEDLRPNDINVNCGIGPTAGILKFYMIDDYSGRNSFDKEAVDSFVKEHPIFQITNVVEIPVITLDDAVKKYCNGLYPDLLTIDVEGFDQSILETADFSATFPKVVVVETVTSKGCSSATLIKLMHSKGYKVFARTYANVIFAHASLNALFL